MGDSIKYYFGYLSFLLSSWLLFYSSCQMYCKKFWKKQDSNDLLPKMWRRDSIFFFLHFLFLSHTWGKIIKGNHQQGRYKVGYSGKNCHKVFESCKKAIFCYHDADLENLLRFDPGQTKYIFKSYCCLTFIKKKRKASI